MQDSSDTSDESEFLNPTLFVSLPNISGDKPTLCLIADYE